MNDRKRGYKHSIFVKILRFLLCLVLLPLVLVCLILKLRRKGVLKKREAELVSIYNVSQIDALSGVEFELLLKDLFEKMGCKVSLTKTSGDFGADLILEKSKESCVVQSKRYSGTVGVSAVQEVVSARSHYGAKSAMVVASSKFSSEAKLLAGECNVDLVDRELLIKLIDKFDVKLQLERSGKKTLSDSAKAEIMAKYKFWI